eukprot:6182128-Pleurochrysis_carterae.AAC.1
MHSQAVAMPTNPRSHPRGADSRVLAGRCMLARIGRRSDVAEVATPDGKAHWWQGAAVAHSKACPCERTGSVPPGYLTRLRSDPHLPKLCQIVRLRD